MNNSDNRSMFLLIFVILNLQLFWLQQRSLNEREFNERKPENATDSTAICGCCFAIYGFIKTATMRYDMTTIGDVSWKPASACFMFALDCLNKICHVCISSTGELRKIRKKTKNTNRWLSNKYVIQRFVLVICVRSNRSPLFYFFSFYACVLYYELRLTTFK